MHALHSEFPYYGWDRNAGYPTREHRAALAEYGPSPYHRLTFGGVREFVPQPGDHEPQGGA